MKSDKDLLLDVGLKLQKEIIEKHIAAGQKASGRTIQAFEVEANDTRLVIYAAPWIMALEDGRGPSKSGKSSVSLKDRIRQWIDDKGITPQDISKDSLAFLISRRIHEQGTILYRKGGRSGVISTVITAERVNNFIEVFAEKYMNKLETELLTEFTK